MIAGARTWMEGEAIRQLERTAELPGMKLAFGLPDLHPGRGHPVGAAFVTEGVFYPLLVGNDIGCGMALFQTELVARKPKLERWAKRLAALDEPWDGDARATLESHGVGAAHAQGLGTVGGGNHFAELCRVANVVDDAAFRAADLDAGRLLLLVHTGSRGLGEAILRAHVDVHRGDGLRAGTAEADGYLRRHDDARRWAEVNRLVVAERFCAATSTEGRRVLDVCHNEVARGGACGPGCFLHRKGAAPADRGLVVLPGSRRRDVFHPVPVWNESGRPPSRPPRGGPLSRWHAPCLRGRMTISTTSRIADIVLDHPETAKVFQAHRIDFCCGGNVTLADTCRSQSLDLDAITAELNDAVQHRAGGGEEDFRAIDTAALIATIVERHHGYLRRALPVVEQLGTKVARVHGNKEPRLVVLASLIHRLREQLEGHLDEEEQELFPLLAAGGRGDEVEEALIDMWHEHIDVGAMLAEMRQVTDGFTPPSWACASYRALFGELETMEMDVLRHVHLENHVLAPRFHHLAP